MNKYYKFIKIMRPKHYLKNLLIFFPLIFSGSFFEPNYLKKAFISFIAFSLIASTVYIINDLNDIELDKLHPTKKFRPISSGAVSPSWAMAICAISFSAALIVQYLANPSFFSYLLLLIYLVINIGYSFGLKNIPIMDISILSFGFLIRVLYVGNSIGIGVSKWLYLAVLAFSFYLSLGKRRNEIKKNGIKTRKVNKHYTQEFLDKNLYMFLGLGITFYSLWAVDPQLSHQKMYWSIPLVMIIAMTYNLTVERDNSDGDPINVLTSSKPLMGLTILCGVFIMILVYVK
jgi:4-hydroxybenzoate polyprenyltransferase